MTNEPDIIEQPTDLVPRQEVSPQVLETVMLQGDLSKLTPAQRLEYYEKVCESVGLNPLTQPFEYLKLSGKLTLYAKRGGADQLRAIHKISIDKPEIKFDAGLAMIVVTGHTPDGRSATDMGAVAIANLKGEPLANAIMKAITKGKRRLTLSIVGLGWLDETEVDSIAGAQRVTVDQETGEITETMPPIPALTPADPEDRDESAQFCEKHGVSFRRFQKDGSSWYSH